MQAELGKTEKDHGTHLFTKLLDDYNEKGERKLRLARKRRMRFMNPHLFGPKPVGQCLLS